MFLALLFVSTLAVAPSPQPTMDIDRAAIRHVVTQQHASVQIDTVIVHGEYALASGASAGGAAVFGLHLARSGWKIACTLQSAPSPNELSDRCGFPAAIATELAADESAQVAVQKGDFGSAAAAEKRAYASASGPDRDQERARVQYLSMLNDQMRTGMITRSQGIQDWSNFRYSWALP